MQVSNFGGPFDQLFLWMFLWNLYRRCQQLIHAPNTLPSLSKHLFPLLSSRSTRNRRKPFQIALPKVRTTRYQHSFFFHTALLWNSLPQSIQATKPPQQFRIALEQLWHKHKHNPTTDIPLPFWIYQQHAEIPQIRAFQLCWEILYILNNKNKTSSIPRCKKVKNDQKLKSRGPALTWF